MLSNQFKEMLYNTAAVGADNGYDSSKISIVYKGKHHRFRRPSFVAPGEPSRANMQGEETDLFGYRTPDNKSDGSLIYTVGDEQDNILRTDNSEFGHSPAARVLLYHCVREALYELGYSGTDPVYCYTGLPVDQYYLGSKPNKKNIDAKINSLHPSGFDAYPVLPLGDTLGPMPKFEFMGCAAQAVSAWQAYALDMDWENYIVKPYGAVGSLKTIVIDFGGRTIDIIPMHKGAPSFADKRSIHDKGTIFLAELLQEEIALNRDDVPYVERLQFRDFRHALITGKITVFSHEFDVSEQRESAVSRYRNEISPLLYSLLEGMTQYEEVLFCGGPIELLIGEDSSRWVPGLLKTADMRDLHTGFMNSDGMAYFSLMAALNAFRVNESRRA